MIRDEKDDRSIIDFVCDVCAPSGWLLKFYVTTIEDVKADPDAEPNECFCPLPGKIDTKKHTKVE